MAFILQDLGISASIFVVLWALVIAYSLWRPINWWIPFIAAFRIVAEAFQLVFAVKGEEYFKWQISYTLMSYQSQYLLILLIINEFVRVCDTRMTQAFCKCRWLSHYKTVVFYAVISNLVNITGIVLYYTLDSIEQLSEITPEAMVGLILQMVGQAWFLAILIAMFFVIGCGWFKDKHNIRILLVIACTFMLVRSVYGELQIALQEISYFYYTSFTDGVVIRKIMVFDKVLGDTMEWLALACLINVTRSKMGEHFKPRTECKV